MLILCSVQVWEGYKLIGIRVSFFLNKMADAHVFVCLFYYKPKLHRGAIELCTVFAYSAPAHHTRKVADVFINFTLLIESDLMSIKLFSLLYTYLVGYIEAS